MKDIANTSAKLKRKTVLMGFALLVTALSVFFIRSGLSAKTDDSVQIEHLTMKSFREKICDCAPAEGGAPVWKYKGTQAAVIDFYAEWCAPCKVLSPVLEQLSREYKGKVVIYKVNTEQQRQLAAMFGISSVPSILFIPRQGKPQMAMGALPKAQIEQIFRDFLGVTK